VKGGRKSTTNGGLSSYGKQTLHSGQSVYENDCQTFKVTTSAFDFKYRRQEILTITRNTWSYPFLFLCI